MKSEVLLSNFKNNVGRYYRQTDNKIIVKLTKSGCVIIRGDGAYTKGEIIDLHWLGRWEECYNFKDYYNEI